MKFKDNKIIEYEEIEIIGAKQVRLVNVHEASIKLKKCKNVEIVGDGNYIHF